MNWQGFWDSDHPIYANSRHRQIHDETLAHEISAEIKNADMIVLDYACGEATAAHRVAEKCATLILSDGALTVREKLKKRYQSIANIMVHGPEETARLEDETLDLVIVNSLLQYLTRDETSELITRLHKKLKPGGSLLIGDVIAPDVSALTDAKALLWFGLRHGFFLAALGGLFRTLFGDYRKIRGALGLTMWEEKDCFRSSHTQDLTRAGVPKILDIMKHE